MALHPQKFCEVTGLQYDKSANTFWGTLQGYPVFLAVVPRRDTVIFRLMSLNVMIRKNPVPFSSSAE